MEQSTYEAPMVTELGEFADETGFWSGPNNELIFFFNEP
jgi:hypothetical protein